MQYRKLGRTDLEVSLIGLGTMTWGRQNTQDEGFEQMDYALEQGINFFDTAEMYAVPPNAETYGKTETIIGNWFNARKNREKVILATKIAGPGMAWVREGNNTIDRKNILLAVEGSLTRLKTDYIDLYQLHWPNRGSYHFGQIWDYAPNFDKAAVEANFIEVLETLDELIKAGKWLELSEKYKLPRMASIQNEYSLMARHFEPDLSEISLHEDCGLLAWSPLTRGLISGKYLNGAMPEGTRLAIDSRKEHRANPQTDATIEAYMALAKEHHLDVCQMALAFVNQQPFVTSNLIGATSMEQLKSNIDSINLTLSQEVIDGIKTVRRRFPMSF